MILMKASIEYSKPTTHFWTEYERLWWQSLSHPVFEAPSLLKYFASVADGDLAIYTCRQDDQLIGAAFFHRENGAYTFLSDLKTDHNCFVIHRDCSDEAIKTFFELFHQKVQEEKWTLVLNNKPMWVPYMELFTRVGIDSNLFWLSAPSSVCPRLEESSPESLYRNLHKSKNNRYKRNRLLREHDAEFEILSGDKDLKEWANDFCNTHVIRWQDTITPSKFRSRSQRQFLLGCMKAWVNDGRLVRFALKAGDKRIAFVIGLVQENSLIYHSLTYHPDYHKYSPGKVLLLYLGEWMKEKSLNVLDFGDGNEAYKYDFANKERKLHSIFITHKTNIPFILKAKLTALVRSHPALIQLYREKLRPISKLAVSRLSKVLFQKMFLIHLHLLASEDISAILV